MLYSVTIRTPIVPCEERETLTQNYLDAAEANRKASDLSGSQRPSRRTRLLIGFPGAQN